MGLELKIQIGSSVASPSFAANSESSTNGPNATMGESAFLAPLSTVFPILTAIPLAVRLAQRVPQLGSVPPDETEEIPQDEITPQEFFDEEEDNLIKLEPALTEAMLDDPEAAKAKLDQVEGLAQHYLQSADQGSPDPQVSETSRAMHNQLAAETYELLARVADANPQDEINRRAPLYTGYQRLAEGDLEGAREIFSGLRQDFPEAEAIAKRMDSDHRRAVNGMALNVWEVMIHESRNQDLDEAHGLLGIGAGIADSVLYGKTKDDLVYEKWNLETDLLKEVRGKIEQGKSETIHDALNDIAAHGSEAMSQRAKQILSEESKRSENGGYLLAHLVRYAAEDADPDKTQDLFDNANELASRNGIQTAYAVHSLLQATADPVWQAQSAAKIKELEAGKGLPDHLWDMIRTTEMDEVAIEILVMKGAQTVGALAKLATLNKLQKAGITGYRALAVVAEIGAEGSAFGTMRLGQEAATHDVEQVFTPGHVAKIYGSNLIMIGGLKVFGAVGAKYAPQAARALKLVTEDGEQLSPGGETLVGGLHHFVGVSGMVATNQVNQGIGLSDRPKGGFWESLADDVFSYIKYGIAQHGADRVLGSEQASKSQALNRDIALSDTKLKVEANLKALGYQAEARDPEGNPIFNKAKTQELYTRLILETLAKPGFDSGKLVSLFKDGKSEAAQDYLKGFGLQLRSEGKMLLGLDALPTQDSQADPKNHPEVKTTANSPLSPDQAKMMIALLRNPLHSLLLGMALGVDLGGSSEGSSDLESPSAKDPELAELSKGLAELRDQDPRNPEISERYKIIGDYLAEKGDSRGDLINYEIERQKLLAQQANPESAKALRPIEEKIKEIRTKIETNILARFGVIVSFGFDGAKGFQLKIQGSANSTATSKAFRGLLQSEYGSLLSRVEIVGFKAKQEWLLPEENLKELSGLRELVIVDCPEQLRNNLPLLFQSQALDQLRVLDLSGNFINDQGAQGIASSPRLKNLRTLILQQNGMLDAGVRAIADSPYLKNLENLNLNLSGVSYTNGRSIAASKIPDNLGRSALQYRGLSDASLQAIARSGALTKLKSLSLRSNGLDSRARETLESGELPNLEYFNGEKIIRETPTGGGNPPTNVAPAMLGPALLGLDASITDHALHVGLGVALAATGLYFGIRWLRGTEENPIGQETQSKPGRKALSVLNHPLLAPLWLMLGVDGLGEMPALALTTKNGRKISYPFPEAVERKKFLMGSSRYDSVRKQLDPEGEYLPEALGDPLGRGGQHEVYRGHHGEVLRVAKETRVSERMLHVQKVLEAFDIPHLKLCDDPLALKIAAEGGITIQEELPPGAKSLDDMTRGKSSYREVEEWVARNLGDKALEQLRQIKTQIYQVDSDPALRMQGAVRGYNVTVGLYGGPESGKLLDVLGGGAWSANLYYAPDRGWFLADW